MTQRIFKLDIESGALGLGLAHRAAPKDGILIPHSLLPEVMAAITRELIAPHLERQDDHLIELAKDDKVGEVTEPPLAEDSASSGGLDNAGYWSVLDYAEGSPSPREED